MICQSYIGTMVIISFGPWLLPAVSSSSLYSVAKAGFKRWKTSPRQKDTSKQKKGSRILSVASRLICGRIQCWSQKGLDCCRALFCSETRCMVSISHHEALKPQLSEFLLTFSPG
mmetsp:Transcript_10981/g.15269  ORF Transcript_10981/g.15269 Transcript_10981/m.15269 type:complete len:115 (+) Transcript_10981:355-699(+)